MGSNLGDEFWTSLKEERRGINGERIPFNRGRAGMKRLPNMVRVAGDQASELRATQNVGRYSRQFEAAQTLLRENRNHAAYIFHMAVHRLLHQIVGKKEGEFLEVGRYFFPIDGGKEYQVLANPEKWLKRTEVDEKGTFQAFKRKLLDATVASDARPQALKGKQPCPLDAFREKLKAKGLTE